MASTAPSSSGWVPAPAVGLPQHVNIVALETVFTGLPPITLPAPHTFSLTVYERTHPDEVAERLKDADIAIVTTVVITAKALESCPRLRLITAIVAGTDSLDLPACKARGIRVLNAPGANVDAVAEHAVGLYFAARRKVVPSMQQLHQGLWPERGTIIHSALTNGNAPRSCRDETVAIVGYGGVGKRIVTLFKALGMKVIITGRKGQDSAPEGRVPFLEALAVASVVVMCCPLDADTANLISTVEFAAMKQADCVLVNVARGGVVDEEALLKALQSGQIGGAAVDVFAVEPAGPDTSPLLTPEVAASGLNLVVTPHTAWLAAQTKANQHVMLLENLNGFITGDIVPERLRA
ncbi:hypothetical protein SEUCBS139899_008267 [Sporothrix eucalyptigena]|uniref:Glycerate dehydrogenase n=1 Tax=Sporothrix eucalyptigena TaxID=1812306 RepID=A0ABP0CE50_9PEZI